MTTIFSLYGWLKDFLFPPFCVGCNRMGAFLCQRCRAMIPRSLQSNPCCGCGIFIPSIQPGITCQMCQEKGFPLDGLFSAGEYVHHKILGKMIRALKYDCCKEMTPYLGRFMLDMVQQLFSTEGNLIGESSFDHKNIVFVPIPLSKQRLRQRGFNQADLLACYVGNILGIDVITDFLSRIDIPQSQVQAKKHDRFEQIKGVFRINNSKGIDSAIKIIVIFDDVYTTGATMIEAAITIKNAFPAMRLYGLVAGRTLLSQSAENDVKV